MDYEDFLSKLGSGTPAPGGGSASAMVGSISAALSRMVANLTAGKKGYEQHSETVNRYAIELEKLEKRFLELSKEDEEAFNEISATWKLPKNTDEEKKIRREKMRLATLKALNPPWNIAATAVSVLDYACKLVEIGNKNAISDAACSAEFALATVRSALFNVKINLSGISDTELVESETLKMNVMTDNAEELHRRALNLFEERLNTKKIS